ncbi:MAG: lipocalin family protein [Fidelibacterota bacterium]|nr:MAG: lipocalin family protein [Candidatus Neomarinimicrobiota bacterium]
MRIAVTTLAFIFIPLILSSCAGTGNGKTKDIPLATDVDLTRYAGRWYEIARFQHRFERDLVNVTATYTLRDDGRIEVLNQGYKGSPDGKRSDAKAVAWVPDPAVPARLKVRFFWPFAADYRIIALDQEGYQYAMVTSSSWRYFWILGRLPQMDEETYAMLVSKAQAYGFDVSQIYKVPQDW